MEGDLFGYSFQSEFKQRVLSPPGTSSERCTPVTLTSKANAAEATPATLHGAGQPWTLAKQLPCPLALHPGDSLHHPRKPRSGGISRPPARTRDLVRPPVSPIWSKAQPPDKACVHKITRNNPWAPHQPACCPCPSPPPNHCPRSQGLWGRPLGPSPSGVGKLQAGAAVRGRAPSHTSRRAPRGDAAHRAESCT